VVGSDKRICTMTASVGKGLGLTLGVCGGTLLCCCLWDCMIERGPPKSQLAMGRRWRIHEVTHTRHTLLNQRKGTLT
jgi:hypothetical protein